MGLDRWRRRRRSTSNLRAATNSWFPVVIRTLRVPVHLKHLFLTLVLTGVVFYSEFSDEFPCRTFSVPILKMSASDKFSKIFLFIVQRVVECVHALRLL